MSDFLGCAVIEIGVHWVAVGGLLVAVAIFLAIGLSVQVFRSVLGSPHSRIAVQVREWIVTVAGPMTAQVLIVVMMLVLLVPVAGVWWFYDTYADHYSVNFDAQGIDTLESMRLTLKNDPNTRLTVIVADKLKPFKVKGTFDGTCMADLFEAVCRAYPSDLRCSRSYTMRTLTISTP
jgi:hypothetical protein